MNDKRKPRKAPLNVQYVVREKEQVDEMKKGFEAFLKRCTIFDRGQEPGDIPVMLSQEAVTGRSEKCLVVNLDPSCEVALHEFDSVVSVIYNIGEVRITLKGGEHFKVRVGVMGPDEN